MTATKNESVLLMYYHFIASQSWAPPQDPRTDSNVAAFYTSAQNAPISQLPASAGWQQQSGWQKVCDNTAGA